MTPLRQQMHDAMLVRGLAERTRQTYIKNVARLAIFYHQNPSDLNPKQVESWLLHLVRDRKLSYSTLNGQGFLSRCLTAWPESTIGSRHIDAFEQPRGREEIIRLFAKLKRLTESEPQTSKNKQELVPVELPLSTEAQQMAMGALNQFETLMQSGNDLSELRDRASKAVENACRIAGVFTSIEKGMAARMIDDKRLGRALIIVQWYLAEALRIRGVAIIPQAVRDAESLSRWLDERGFKMFRSKQVLQKGPTHLRNKTRLNAAIKELVDNGYLEQNDPGTIVDDVNTRKSWSVLHVV